MALGAQAFCGLGQDKAQVQRGSWSPPASAIARTANVRQGFDAGFRPTDPCRPPVDQGPHDRWRCRWPSRPRPCIRAISLPSPVQDQRRRQQQDAHVAAQGLARIRVQRSGCRRRSRPGSAPSPGARSGPCDGHDLEVIAAQFGCNSDRWASRSPAGRAPGGARNSAHTTWRHRRPRVIGSPSPR